MSEPNPLEAVEQAESGEAPMIESSAPVQLEEEDDLLVHAQAPEDLGTSKADPPAFEETNTPLDPLAGPAPAFGFDPLAPEPPPMLDAALPEQYADTTNVGATNEAEPSTEVPLGSVEGKNNEAAFTPQQASAEGGEISQVAPAAIMAAYDPDAGPVKVYVKDPEKAEASNSLGMKSTYYTFLIRTDSSLQGMLADGMEVRRRFSEFETLHKLLASHYKGCFIPPLPEKSRRAEARLGSGSSLEDFLRLRRADLQAFLRSLVAHPELVQSEPLKLFLLQMGELGRNPAWLNLLEPPPASPATTGSNSGGGAAAPAAPAGGMGNFMMWMKASMTTVGTSIPKKEPPADEPGLMKSKEMLKDLEKLLRIACDTATVMCQDMDKMCEDFRELGRSMGMLARYEEAIQTQSGPETEEGQGAGRRGMDLQKAAISSSKQHGIWRNNCVKTAATLVGLRDFHLLVPEAITALEHREKALSKWEHLETDLWKANHQWENSKALAGLEDKRTVALKYSVTDLEEKIKEAQANYEKIKARNYAELKRFGLSREANFRHMLAQFAATQASLVQSSADAWSQLASQYGAAPGPRSQ